MLQTNGLWRSLVARYLGVVEVVGSNPASPTSLIRPSVWVGLFLGTLDLVIKPGLWFG